MGFFSSVIDPGGVFGGKPLHESLLGNSSEKAAQAQVQSALSAEQLQRRQFNTLREDAAPLRELRNAELGRVNKLLESSGGIGFEDSPEFINVRNAARSVGAGAPTRVRNALMDRAENLAMGQRDRFLNRILTTAGISSQGLNSTNRLLQDNVNARSALFDRAGESAASGIIGASNQKNQALTGLGGLLGALPFQIRRLKKILFRSAPIVVIRGINGTGGHGQNH